MPNRNDKRPDPACDQLGADDSFYVSAGLPSVLA
jgi:hypothetical protein